MRRILCPIAALAMASLVSAPPGRAGELLDFLEYFQAVEIVLETDFTEAELDKILSKARVIHASLSPEAEIRKSLESAFVHKDAEDVKRFLSEGGSSCSLKNKLFSCRISKYEIVRNVGNRSYPSFRRRYDFEIIVGNINKNNRSMNIKYSTTSDKSF